MGAAPRDVSASLCLCVLYMCPWDMPPSRFVLGSVVGLHGDTVAHLAQCPAAPTVRAQPREDSWYLHLSVCPLCVNGIFPHPGTCLAVPGPVYRQRGQFAAVSSSRYCGMWQVDRSTPTAHRPTCSLHTVTANSNMASLTLGTLLPQHPG